VLSLGNLRLIGEGRDNSKTCVHYLGMAGARPSRNNRSSVVAGGAAGLYPF
jgi:hypothetical protein